MNQFRVPLAITLFIIGGAFAALEIISVYSLLTGEPVILISDTEQHDGMVVEHGVGLQVSGPRGHLLVLALIVCSTTAGLLVLRISRAPRRPDAPNAP